MGKWAFKDNKMTALAFTVPVSAWTRMTRLVLSPATSWPGPPATRRQQVTGPGLPTSSYLIAHIQGLLTLFVVSSDLFAAKSSV